MSDESSQRDLPGRHDVSGGEPGPDEQGLRVGPDAPSGHGAPRRRNGRGTGLGRALLALVLLLVLVAIVAGGLYSVLRADDRPLVDVPAGRAVTVIVPAGSTTAEIGQLLAEQGVVANAQEFRSIVRDAGAGQKLLAGTYALRTGMGYEAAIASLTAGPTVVYTKVTIPEGWRIEQVAARFEKQAGIPQAEFLALADRGASEFEADHPVLKGAYRGSLEGFLFPKTYQVKQGATARDVIEMMLRQFDKEIASVDLSRVSARGISVPELVVMGSIVERETKVAKERPIVSSVIYNRLARKMRLDMCSTVEYVIKQHKLRLTYADLNVKSPYNTYRHAGLPPGPIASPGLAALKAAARPTDTEYLYYVLTGRDGSHTFARNASEFEKAKQKSKQVFGE